MNRLGIFVFYDKDGIVDRYVSYLLRTIREHLTDLTVVCNGTLTAEGRSILWEFADELYIRENKGFDAMALKMALTEYIGWEKAVCYDEIIFFNDTFYGPIYPWQEVFSEMDRREADFWGLTGEAESSDYFSCYEKKIPAYIQSYFYAFRHRLVSHPWFQEYWNAFDSTEWIFSDITNKHERIFTHLLEAQGFTADTYVKAELFESAQPEQNFVQYYYIACQLIKKYRCPVIKRKNFIMKHLTENPGEQGNDTMKALEYIKNHTDYDVNLIWENILRLYDMQDIRKTLNLNYIVSGEAARKDAEETVLIFWLSCQRCLPQCLEYIRCLETENIIYIYSQSRKIIQSVQAHLKGKNVICEQVEDREVYCFVYLRCLELAEKYRYIIFLHDVDYYALGYFCLQQYSLLDHLWGNLLQNQNYLSGMEGLFHEQERLGMLTVPQPIFGTYFSSVVEERNPFFVFCCRSEGLKKVSEQGKDLPEKLKLQNEKNLFFLESDAMEILALEFQKAGYYTAAVMNMDYAVTAHTYMQALLKRILQQAKRKNTFSDFDSYLDGEMIAYARRFSEVMVYGAGENGYRAAHLLKKHRLNFAGFIVSDGQSNGKEKYGYPVYPLSELEELEREGVVVSVANPKAQREIEKSLAKRNCTDVFFV